MFQKIRYNSATFVLYALALFPIVVWFFMKPLDARFLSPVVTFRSLGQIAGLLGTTLLCINFVLSARLKFLDKVFDGLNKVYAKHHLIGGLSFGLILFHPTFLAVQFLLTSISAAFGFIFYFGSWALFWGKLGLSVFLLLMVITFYANFKYQNWKNTHKYLGLVLLLGGFHMFLIPSDISNNIILKIYMFALVLSALAAYFYRTIFSIYKKKEYRYELAEIKIQNKAVFEMKFKPLGKKMDYSAGQFVFVRFEIPDGHPDKKTLSESHPFSISAASNAQEITLGVKSLGDFTDLASRLKPGAIALFEGPFGIFTYDKIGSKRQIWIAGGIGITPFLGMARELKIKNIQDYHIDLYYSVRNEKEAAFAEELEIIAGQNKNFKFKINFSDRVGYISADKIKRDTEIQDSAVMICGPQGLMENLRRQFVDLGIANNKIYSEEFSF